MSLSKYDLGVMVWYDLNWRDRTRADEIPTPAAILSKGMEVVASNWAAFFMRSSIRYRPTEVPMTSIKRWANRLVEKLLK